MVKPVFRRKSIGTKVSEEEYAQLEALAEGRAMSEWVREVLLRELDGRQARPADEAVLAEVLGLRTILLNAFFQLANREKITAEEMQRIIDRADAAKVQKAIERLTPKVSS
jgi:predicted transcriptional regulator